MRLVPLLTSAVISISLAAPAWADSDNGDDQRFLNALTKAGITYQSPDRAITAGKRVCGLANAGTSQFDILRNIRDLNPGFTLDSAASFAQAAAIAYCPDRLTAGSGQLKGNSTD